MKCKINNKTLKPFMTFGLMPLANAFLEKKNFKDEYFYNLEVGFSEELSLFQLNDYPSPKKMFNKNYPFFTGSSEFMKIHFKNYFDWIKNNYLKFKSNIIEIGSNDGTFLLNFKNQGHNCIGFEPSTNVADQAKKKDLNIINDFFCLKNVTALKKKNTDIICAANVICHIPDIIDVIKSVDFLLKDDGLFIFEEPYLGAMFNKVSYDQIYDEHIYMFSVSSIKKIFNSYDFELVDVLPQITHGGSMRYVISRKKKILINDSVNIILQKEKDNNIDNISSCFAFKQNCETSKKNILKILNKYKDQKKSVCGYAATSKSTTILNYCNIGSNIIDCIYDTTDEKIGKYSPGMHIPIKPMEDFKFDKPDIAYLFAWNHKDEIFKKEKYFSKRGGVWISHVNI